MSLLKSAVAAAVLAISAQAGATVIDFNGQAQGYYTGAYGAVLANTLTLSTDGGALFMGPGYGGGDSSSYAYNGTDFLMGYSNLTFTRVGSATFSLQSLDLKDWGGGITSTTVTGYFANGGSIVRQISLDSTANYSKQVGNDFTKYALSGFTGLSSFSILSNGYWLAVDNITINAAAVPEPGTLAVFGLGLAGLAAMRRRKQK
ncbi:hypothetical protein ASC94_25620 [Massilia sp. Root418]|jgi:hypothetical protein|uniref:PEP-CTERM sorting domain-containing protein n=1 Tax=Massilia sp. Root418 TaxID=1736532 RepID=UPI0006F9C8DC|nr:PEP-CTERM sorting domain-containing protein [Massilia sp. Root418]KQW87876.1 hypothetical protein ASC94_25620 [Massilia sp. Root418]